MPYVIIDYWLSKIIGILLMQGGVIDMFQNQERNFKKELSVYRKLLRSLCNECLFQ